MKDQRPGARLATRCLLAAGCRVTWHLAGSEKRLEAEGRVTVRAGNRFGGRAGV
ncbi:hypothetical protein [Streptomyces azureus]|nr:hypothetical protein [Streptomyces azureus]